MNRTPSAVVSALIASALVSAPARAAITFVNAASTASSNPGATSANLAVPISTTAGNDVVVVITYDVGGGSLPSVRDSGGSSYGFRVGLTNPATHRRMEIWSARNVAASTQVTVSFTPAASSPAASVLQYAGVAAVGSTGSAAGDSANPSLSVTTQDDNDFVVGGFEIDDLPTVDPNQGSLRTKAQAGGYSICGADNTAATASSVATGVTIGTATTWVAAALELRSGAVTGIIPADRATTWKPGIPGGVPPSANMPVCANVSPPLPPDSPTQAIQSALDSCPAGQVVQLAAGTFNLDASIFITKGVVLRGAPPGPSQTRLVTSAQNAAPIVIGTRFFKFTQPTNLASDAVKGTRTAVLTSVAGLTPPLAVGELVLIDTVTNALTEWSPSSPPGDVSRGWYSRFDRPISQVMEVESVSGNTVTFTTPFHIGFATADQAQLSRFSHDDGGPVVPSVRSAGVEDLYVSGGRGGQGNIQVENCAYCWAKNIESDFQDGAAVSLDGTFRSVLRDSYIHSTQTPNPGGGGYGISFTFGSADNLVENNISWNMNKVMVMRASGGGNVIGYNYMQDGWIDFQPLWVEVGLNASHMTTPHYELFEGNESFNFDGDNTWGNSIYITVFRNHLTTHRRAIGPLANYSFSCGIDCTFFYEDGQNRRGIALTSGHQWYTFVGNVIGYSGMSNPPLRSSETANLLGFEYEQTNFTDGMIPMWELGYNPPNFDLPPDPRVTSTVIRDGNFDFFTNTVKWDRPERAIPNSLYLTSPPPFFSGYTWPWVDPLGTTKTYRLPARDRFDAIQGLPQGGAD